MESKAKLLGHPIHPMLIPIPLGLFIVAVLLDIGCAVSRNQGAADLSVVSFWNIVLGIAGGLLAAVFGYRDWLAIPARTRAKRVGLLHAGTNIVVLLLFAGAAQIRRDHPAFAPNGLALDLEIAALIVGAVAGWLGGELVDRLAWVSTTELISMLRAHLAVDLRGHSAVDL